MDVPESERRRLRTLFVGEYDMENIRLESARLKLAEERVKRLLDLAPMRPGFDSTRLTTPQALIATERRLLLDLAYAADDAEQPEIATSAREQAELSRNACFDGATVEERGRRLVQEGKPRESLNIR